ncbi:MAG: YchJ family metal-binding protein [Polyangiales bacterium]
MSRPTPCPCTSGEPYARCCGPYHLGAAEADTPTALMRSRFAAFARADVNYLYRTLHPDHPDRAAPEAQVRRALAESARSHRYMGLTILDARGPDAEGVAQVLFHARIFEKGRERSFTECSDFVQDGVGWRYLRGVLRPGAPVVTRIDAFLAG